MDNSKIKILIVPSDRAGVGHFRSIWAAKHLKKNRREDFNITIDASPDFTNLNYLTSFDIIHFHRQLGPYENSSQLFPRLQESGVILIMDIDDYWSPPPTHPLYDLIKKENISEKIENNLSLVDWVTTTTDIFANRIRKINNNVFVIPNAVQSDSKQWRSEAVEAPEGKTRVAWIGGSCYDDKTEILTDQGYKLFQNLDGSEKVATLNPETHEVEFFKPNNYISEPYKGNLQCAKSNDIDFAVTPNHKMLVSYNGSMVLRASDEVYGKEYTTFTTDAHEITETDEVDVAVAVKIKQLTVSKDIQFEKEYDGIVYCVNVQNNIVHVRRNGKTMWCGNSHLHDLYLLKDSMEMLAADEELKKKTQIVMCGFDTRGDVTEYDANGRPHKRPIKPHESIWIQFERIFTANYNLLKDNPQYIKWLQKIQKEGYDNIYKEDFVRRWTQPLTSYAEHYDYCDICLAPLVETFEQKIGKGFKQKTVKRPHIFNEVKSELKVIEAGVKRKALIAQDFAVYREKIIDGETGILVKNNKKGWYNAIKKLVENPEYRNELANNLHEWVKEEYSIDRINGIRADFYQKICAQQRKKVILH